MRKLVTFLGLTGLLLAAAPAFASNDQNVRVFTYPEVNAHCTLENSVGFWTVSHTPMNASIERAPSGLTVSCRSADGFWSGHVVAGFGANPGVLLTAPMNVAELLVALGNAPIDTAAAEEAIGHAFRYPGGVVVPMVREVEDVKLATPVEPIAIAAPAATPVRHHVVHRRHVVHRKAKTICKPGS